MMLHLDTLIAILIAYFFGSFSSAIIVCKVMGLPDPRTQGSRNPGATNVLRIGNKKAAIMTLLGDVLKGAIPVLAAKWYDFNAISMSLITLAAFIGHLYPIFFRFEGGKGVATAFGCLSALSWPAGIALFITWLVVAIISRYSSLAALITAAMAPFYMKYFTNFYYAVTTFMISLLLIYRHRKNIANLLTGKEKKIGQKI